MVLILIRCYHSIKSSMQIYPISKTERTENVVLGGNVSYGQETGTLYKENDCGLIGRFSVETKAGNRLSIPPDHLSTADYVFRL